MSGTSSSTEADNHSLDMGDAVNGHPTKPSFDVHQGIVSELVVHAAIPSVAALCIGQVPIINNLPPELLIGIFSFCTMLDPIRWVKPSSESQASMRFKPGWLNLTYVCGHWRNLALNHPALWSSYATNEFGLQWMETILECSMHMPVSLHFNLGSATAGAMESMAKHMFHVSDITLTGRMESRTALFNVLASPAPMLDTMRMETEMILPELVSQSWNNPAIWMPELPGDTFSSQAPRLRQLLLVDFFPPLTVPVSPILLGIEHLGITSWSLKFLKYKFATHFHGGSNAASLFIFLQHMKQLRTLALKSSLPRVDSASTDNTIIDLPSLQFLEIDDNVPECSIFLQHLRIPNTTQLSIRCNCMGNSPAWTAVTSFLRVHMDAGSPPIQALSLSLPDFRTRSYWTSLKVVAWRSIVTFPTDSTLSGFAIAFSVTIPNRVPRRRNMTAPFTEVLNTLPLASVQTAQYELPLGETCDLAQTVDVMRCTPEVESLWVTGPGSAVVAKALQQQQTASQIAPPAPTLVLPSLRILGFTKVNLDAKRDTQLEPGHRKLRAKLRAVLQARKNMDGRKLKLYIQKCTITAEWLEGLGKVADVEWDGKNTSFPDE